MKVAVLLTLLVPAALGAQTPRFGLEAFASAPMQGLRDGYAGSALGGGLGLFAEWELDRGHSVQLLFAQATTYGERTKAFLVQGPGDAQPMLVRQDMRTSRSFFGPEVHLSLSGARRGAYLLAGLGLGYVSSTSDAVDPIDVSSPGDPSLDASARIFADSGLRFQWMVGAGYRLGPDWDLKLRYTTLASNGRQLASTDLGVAMRF